MAAAKKKSARTRTSKVKKTAGPKPIHSMTFAEAVAGARRAAPQPAVEPERGTTLRKR